MVYYKKPLHLQKAYNNLGYGTGDFPISEKISDTILSLPMHPYLTQYKGLALTNVDINYTPDGSYSTYMGGYPSAVELSIQMVETKIVYKEDLQQKRDWSY